jgi:hypothetical protein
VRLDWNLSLSIASLLTGGALSVLSIALSAYFYTQAKNTESRVQVSLGEIRQQTDSLNKLAGRMLDRLTRAVTEIRPAHEERQLLVLVEAMRTMVHMSPQQQHVQAVEPDQQVPPVQVLAAAYLHAAIANACIQSLLPESMAAARVRA